MSDDAAQTQTQTTRLTRRLLAPNPGPMTLEGTNSYAIGVEGSPIVVVDPGPADPRHLTRLAALGRVELVLATHHHPDHVEAARAFAAGVGAPLRAADLEWCADGDPLADGELIEAAGTRILVMATPGHTADSICLVLPDDGPTASVLTGDTVLGRGSTIIAHPDGALGDYLTSLEKLRLLGPLTVLPGHGPALTDLAAACAAYQAHRQQRLAEVRGALDRLGWDADVSAATDAVYAEVEPALRDAAEASMRAQLDYLRGPAA